MAGSTFNFIFVQFFNFQLNFLHFVNVAEERVDESLIDILKLGFGRDFEP